MSHDEILRKVKKLLALASNNPNKDEAASAASKAQALLFVHNLELFDVADAHREIHERDFQSGPESFAAWQEQLLAGVARYSFCRAIGYEDEYEDLTGVRFIGQKHDIAVAAHLYIYVSREILRLSEEALAAFIVEHTHPTLGLQPRFQRPAMQQTWTTSFRMSAVQAVLSRLKAQQQTSCVEADAARPGVGTELMRRSDAALDEYVQQRYQQDPQACTKNVGVIVYTGIESAEIEGAAAGAAIPLHKVVDVDVVRRATLGPKSH